MIVLAAAAGKYVPVVIEKPLINDEEPTSARRVGELVRGHCRAYIWRQLAELQLMSYILNGLFPSDVVW